MNTFGTLFRLTTFGESHGPAYGAVIDGCPAGVALTEAAIQVALDRRRPGQSDLTTNRQEGDRVEVLSGLYQGKTLGTPIAGIVRNQDQRPTDYEPLKDLDRPGHADAVWRERFKHRDHRGGGRTSGRETLSRVIGGAVAEALLAREIPDHRSVAWVSQVESMKAQVDPGGLTRAQVDAHPTRCPQIEIADQMSARIREAKASGESLGGSVDLWMTGLPVGLGEPVFGKFKSLLAGALSGIGAVSGLWWGPEDLPAAIGRPGSAFHADSEAYGGIQGGLSNGLPVHLRVLIKPPATLGNLARGGRHDPCILPRVVPVIEAMAALVCADLWLHWLAHPHRP
jgi:chorismate synthase